MDRRSQNPPLFEFHRLIPDSVGVAMRAADPAVLLRWVRDRLPAYTSSDSPLLDSPTLTRTLAFAFTRALWNGLPVNAAGRKPRPMREPEPGDACPCGSGRRFKSCCHALPQVPVLTPDALWPHVLANIRGAEREVLLTNNRIPRTALIEIAAHLLECNLNEDVIAVLEPSLAHPERYHDESAAILLDLLCDAYGMTAVGAPRKLKLLESTAARAPCSPLRAEAWQRLATIYMDCGDPQNAWDAFHAARRDHPDSEILAVLEAELTAAANGAERRSEPLLQWLADNAQRPVPHYLLSQGRLVAPAEVSDVEKLWRQFVHAAKPFGTQDQVFEAGVRWESGDQRHWCRFLNLHPESFDSVDILDDLATAIGRHPQWNSARIEHQLLDPVLQRNRSIVQSACAAGGNPSIPWSKSENRPALRGLMRLLLRHLARDDSAEAGALGVSLLRLNPADDHGVRQLLLRIDARINRS